MKINNIDDLREHAIETLEKLSSGKFSIEHAVATSKLCDNVISSVKLQIEVARMLRREPNIPFLGNSMKGKIIEHPRLYQKKLNKIK